MPKKVVGIDQIREMNKNMNLSCETEHSIWKGFMDEADRDAFRQGFDQNHFNFTRENPSAFCVLYMLGKRKKDGSAMYHYEDILDPEKLQAEKKAIGKEILTLLNKENPDNINTLNNTYLDGLYLLSNATTDKVGEILTQGKQSDLVNRNMRIACNICNVGLENLIPSQQNVAENELKDKANQNNKTSIKPEILESMQKMRDKFSNLFSGVNVYYQFLDTHGSLSQHFENVGSDESFVDDVFRGAIESNLAFTYMKYTYRRNGYAGESSVPTAVLPNDIAGMQKDELPDMLSLSPYEFVEEHINALTPDEAHPNKNLVPFEKFKSEEVAKWVNSKKSFRICDDKQILSRYGMMVMAANGELVKDLKWDSEYNTRNNEESKLNLTNLDFKAITQKDLLRAAFLSDMAYESVDEQFYLNQFKDGMEKIIEIDKNLKNDPKERIGSMIQLHMRRIEANLNAGDYRALSSSRTAAIGYLEDAFSGIKPLPDDLKKTLDGVKTTLNQMADNLFMKGVLISNGGQLDPDTSSLDGQKAGETIQQKYDKLVQFDQKLDELEQKELSDEWRFLRRTVRNAMKVMQNVSNESRDELTEDNLERACSAMKIVQYAAGQFVAYQVEQENFDEEENFDRLVQAKQLESYATQNIKQMNPKILEVIPAENLMVHDTIESSKEKIHQYVEDLTVASGLTVTHSNEFNEMFKAVKKLEIKQDELVNKEDDYTSDDDWAYYGENGAVATALKKVDTYIRHLHADYTMDDYSVERLGIALRLRTYLNNLNQNAGKTERERYDKYGAAFRDADEYGDDIQRKYHATNIKPFETQKFEDDYYEQIRVGANFGLGKEKENAFAELLGNYGFLIKPGREDVGTFLACYMLGQKTQDGRPRFEVDDVIHEKRIVDEKNRAYDEACALLKNPTKETIEKIDRCLLSGMRRIGRELGKSVREAFEKNRPTDFFDYKLRILGAYVTTFFANWPFETNPNKNIDKFQDRMLKMNGREYQELSNLQFVGEVAKLATDKIRMFQERLVLATENASPLAEFELAYQHAKEVYDRNRYKQIGNAVPTAGAKMEEKNEKLEALSPMHYANTVMQSSDQGRNIGKGLYYGSTKRERMLSTFGLKSLSLQQKYWKDVQVSPDHRPDGDYVTDIQYEVATYPDLIRAAFSSDMYVTPLYSDIENYKSSISHFYAPENFIFAKEEDMKALADAKLGLLDECKLTYVGMEQFESRLDDEIDTLRQEVTVAKNQANAELKEIRRLSGEEENKEAKEEPNAEKKPLTDSEYASKLSREWNDNRLRELKAKVDHQQDCTDLEKHLYGYFKAQEEDQIKNRLISNLATLQKSVAERNEQISLGCYLAPVSDSLDSDAVLRGRGNRLETLRANVAAQSKNVKSGKGNWKFMQKMLDYATQKFSNITSVNACSPKSLETVYGMTHLLDFAAGEFLKRKLKESDESIIDDNSLDCMQVAKQIKSYAVTECKQVSPELKATFQLNHRDYVSHNTIAIDLEKMKSFRGDLREAAKLTYTHSKEFNEMQTAVDTLIAMQETLNVPQEMTPAQIKDYYGDKGAIAQTMAKIQKYVGHKAEQLNTEEYSMKRLDVAASMYGFLRTLSENARNALPAAFIEAENQVQAGGPAGPGM